MNNDDYTLVGPCDNIDFVSHGTYSGMDKCEVIIECVEAAESNMDQEEDTIMSVPTFHFYNAEVSGKNLLQVSTHVAKVYVRPTSVSFGQDRVIVDGVVTWFAGFDDRGEEFVMSFPILVRAQVLYIGR